MDAIESHPDFSKRAGRKFIRAPSPQATMQAGHPPSQSTMADLGGDAAAAEDEGDLYGDLDAVPLAKKAEPSKASASKTTIDAGGTSGTPGIAPLTLHGIGKVYDEAAMQQLRADNDRLRAENETLKRNIGTLYRTAKAELARKDERIASLQGQVDSKM